MHAKTQNSPYARLRSLPHASIQIHKGFWADRQWMNREKTLLNGYTRLNEAGNFENLRLAAGLAQGTYQGPLFMDSDLYKWLEAVAWELGRQPDAEKERWLDDTAVLLAQAQQPDGYLNSYFTVVAPEKRWQDLDHGHELYCAGHLIQAAVAAHRALGKTHLLEIACRFAENIYDTFGPGKREGYCGHPEIEMALVELYRETGERRFLELARVMIDRRGQKRMRGYAWYGPEYMQDQVPLRQAKRVEGHAVRQLYLTAGAADVYLETGEQDLLAALETLWEDAVRHKMHLIGGYGARFEGEAFGGAYELPSDRCYCETCAAIAAMMWNWRMLLATGEARFAEVLERSLYNNFLSGVALDGQTYFYTNLLQSQGGIERNRWFGTACCPPNIMRQIAALGQYIATEDAQGVQIHQYVSAQIETTFATLSLVTDYPWEGTVLLTIEALHPAGAQPGDTWAINLRIPSWAAGATYTINHGRSEMPVRPGQYARLVRAWQPGDQVELHLPLRARLTVANPRADAIRGSLAIERGPLVYCVEAVGALANQDLLDVRIDATGALHEVWQPDLLGGVIAIDAEGSMVVPSMWGDDLYLPAVQAPRLPVRPVKLTAVPYFTWANRGPVAMRVWLPRL